MAFFSKNRIFQSFRVLSKCALQANVQKSGWFKRAIFNFAYNRKLALLKKGIFCNDTIWDRLVFSKIQVVFFTANNSSQMLLLQ